MRFLKALWRYLLGGGQYDCRRCQDTGIFYARYQYDGDFCKTESWCVCERGREMERDGAA